jgi:hypothetical protein
MIDVVMKFFLSLGDRRSKPAVDLKGAVAEQ